MWVIYQVITGRLLMAAGWFMVPDSGIVRGITITITHVRLHGDLVFIGILIPAGAFRLESVMAGWAGIFIPMEVGAVTVITMAIAGEQLFITGQDRMAVPV
jgi:hypothetical protein